MECKEKRKRNLLLILFLSLFFLCIFIAIFLFMHKPVYKVSFDLNGGSLISGELTQNIKKGSHATAPKVEKKGYYLSWDKSFKKITSKKTIKAVWTNKTYAVTLVHNNGKPNTTQTVTYDKPFHFDVPQKNNCYFDGFYHAQNGAGKRYTNFENIGTGLWQTDSNITLYANWFAGTEGILYTLDTDTDEYSVTGFEFENIGTALVIAGSINDKPVTKINSFAFNKNFDATETLLIPYGIKKIEDAAFNSNLSLPQVKSLVFPNTLTHIGTSAFSFFYKIEFLVVPSSVEYVGRDGISGPENVIAMFYCDASVFDGCPFYSFGSPLRYAKLILVPPQYLDNYLSLSWLITSIYSNEIIKNDSLATDGDNFVSYFGKDSRVEVADNIKEIHKLAFAYFYPEGADPLEEVILPENLEKINDLAFMSRKNISSITIPASVSFVGDSAFSNWTEEQTIYVTRSSLANWSENWHVACNAKVFDENGIEVLFN